MDKITNALKCVNCPSVLVSPVFLPCFHSVCKHHAPAGSKSIICCECGEMHEIPTNGFRDNKPLAEIISTQVHEMDLGQEYNQAKLSWLSYESLINYANVFLTDPSLETYAKINGMKNDVQLKREELKLEIDKESEKLIKQLDDYLVKFRHHLNDEKNKHLELDLEQRSKEATIQLEKFKNRFDLINAGEKSWTATSNEIDLSKQILSKSLENLKNSLVINSDIQELNNQTQSFQLSSFQYQNR